MRFDGASQGLLQVRGPGQVAPLTCRHDIVDDHALDQQLTIRALDQVLAQLDRHRLRQLLVLRASNTPF
jgi:hypothetical protein